MALRCLLFTADEVSADPIRQVLAGLHVEGEHCAVAADAVERVTNQNFQIVILDWDAQPEAAQLLKAARERKAAERPLTLAMVGDDASVPQALQAGANSILRKPILVNQAKDTLTTARDLLRAKETAAQSAAAAAAAKSAALPVSLQQGNEKALRAGEFLQSAGPIPSAQFDTESDLPDFSNQEIAAPVVVLEELEPMAAAVAPEPPREEPVPGPVAPPQPDEPRGLQWYLNRKGSLPPVPGRAPAAPPSAAPEKVELLGFDQPVSPEPSLPPRAPSPGSLPAAKIDPLPSFEIKSILSESHAPSAEPEPESPTDESATPRQGFHLGKGAIAAALALAACAIVAAPQAPWHRSVVSVCSRGQQSLHAWLNPQVETKTAQAPTAHEDFGRAGDEYKLPVAENIPDATTDPSQIRVTPVVDPTAKKTEAANPDAAVPATADSPDSKEPVPIQVQPGPASSVPPGASAVTAANPVPTASTPVSVPVTTPPPAPRVVPTSGTRSVPTLSTSSAANTPHIPSSLTSQMASITPAAGGDKPPEAASQAIEPVSVPEPAERALLLDQPAIGYPDNAKGQQGTIVLLVLIGRDGTVQDAKFLQGSLAFARTAIEGVKGWKFKPYMMNGRPVSVTTQLSMTFKPGM